MDFFIIFYWFHAIGASYGGVEGWGEQYLAGEEKQVSRAQATRASSPMALGGNRTHRHEHRP